MKKLLALVTSLVMVAMMFTGCTSDELAFYQASKSMSALQNYSYTGNVSIKVPTLKVNPNSNTTTTADTTTSTGTGITDTATELQALLNNSTITYSGSVDSKNHKVTMNFNVKMGNSLSIPISLILNNANNKSLLDVSASVASLFSSYIPSTYKHTVVTINKVSYYQYDLNSIIAQLNDAQSSSTNTDTDTGTINSAVISLLSSLTTVTKTTTLQQSIQKKALALEDTIMNKSFKNLNNLGLVKKTATDTYTLHLTTKNAVSALESLLTYMSTNSTAFKTALASFANSLTDSEIASLKISGLTTKAQLVTLLNSVDLSSLSTVIPTLTSELTPIVNSVAFDYKYTLKKTNYKTLIKGREGCYDITQSVSFDDTKYTDAPVFVVFSITGKQKITY